MIPMQPPPAPSPEPGERRRLDHPPSDRYRTEPDAPAGAADADATVPLADRERVLRGIAVGLGGAIVITVLGGPLSVTVGLVGAAGAIGYLVGAAMRPLRLAAVVVAVGAVILGLVGIWIFAGIEGGVLGIVDYLADVQGILVPIQLLVAGALAAVGSWSS
jgi:hypothetical protein